MRQADDNPSPAETSIPIYEATQRLLKICLIRTVKPTFESGLKNGQIHVTYLGVEGRYGPEDPMPVMSAFFRADPRGPTLITPGFPWPQNSIRRHVVTRIPSADYYRMTGKVPMRPQLLADYTAYGLAVNFTEVLSMFSAAVQAAWAAYAAAQGTLPTPDEPMTRTETCIADFTKPMGLNRHEGTAGLSIPRIRKAIKTAMDAKEDKRDLPSDAAIWRFFNE